MAVKHQDAVGRFHCDQSAWTKKGVVCAMGEENSVGALNFGLLTVIACLMVWPMIASFCNILG